VQEIEELRRELCDVQSKTFRWQRTPRPLTDCVQDGDEYPEDVYVGEFPVQARAHDVREDFGLSPSSTLSASVPAPISPVSGLRPLVGQRRRRNREALGALRSAHKELPPPNDPKLVLHELRQEHGIRRPAGAGKQAALSLSRRRPSSPSQPLPSPALCLFGEAGGGLSTCALALDPDGGAGRAQAARDGGGDMGVQGMQGMGVQGAEASVRLMHLPDSAKLRSAREEATRGGSVSMTGYGRERKFNFLASF
jgi:hypothetical protein